MKKQKSIIIEPGTPLYYMNEAWVNLMKNGDLRDLGKIFAEPNEYIQRDWINKNTKLNVIKRCDYNLDPDASGYDLHTEDGVLKIQSKLRASDIHLEQTRRKSKKNMNSSDTGHVRYSIGEADVYIFSRPDTSDYGNLALWKYIVIPEDVLKDPKNPKYLLPRVPKKIWKNYIGKAIKTLESIYDEKKSIFNRR